MRFTREQVKKLQADLEVAAREIAARHGAVFVKSKGTYGEKLAVAVEFGVIGADGVVESADANAYRSLCVAYGLKPEWLGQTFTSAGVEYRVAGLLPRRSKNPVLVERISDGKRFIYPVIAIKGAMATAAA